MRCRRLHPAEHSATPRAGAARLVQGEHALELSTANRGLALACLACPRQERLTPVPKGAVAVGLRGAVQLTPYGVECAGLSMTRACSGSTKGCASSHAGAAERLLARAPLASTSA